MSNHVSIAREGRVARIALNRPEKRNVDTGAILLTGDGAVFKSDDFVGQPLRLRRALSPPPPGGLRGRRRPGACPTKLHE